MSDSSPLPKPVRWINSTKIIRRFGSTQPCVPKALPCRTCRARVSRSPRGWRRCPSPTPAVAGREAGLQVVGLQAVIRIASDTTQRPESAAVQDHQNRAKSAAVEEPAGGFYGGPASVH